MAGHNIPSEVIERRYLKGIKNLFEIYMPIVDHTMIFDNTFGDNEIIAESFNNEDLKVYNSNKLNTLKNYGI